MTRAFWSADDDRAIREAVRTRQSARDCGLVLNRTRNAVIGRAHRLGVKLCGGVPGRPRTRPFILYVRKRKPKPPPISHARPRGFAKPSLPVLHWLEAHH